MVKVKVQVRSGQMPQIEGFVQTVGTASNLLLQSHDRGSDL